MQDIKFDFDDIKLVPADSSVIKSRKNVNTQVNALKGFFYLPQTLPLMSAPMDSVVSSTRTNYNPAIIADLLNAGIRPVVPRNTDVFPDTSLHSFMSLSLDEVKKFIGADLSTAPYPAICIDMANGHMADLATTIRLLKAKFPALTLMVGNIANPYTYKVLSDAGADYVRCGIGSGSGCFVDGTLVTTAVGLKPIEQVVVGDSVLTHKGVYKYVTHRLSYYTNEELVMINGVACTKNHEFFVVLKVNRDYVHNNKSLEDYGFFIEAGELNDTHLIVSWENKSKAYLNYNLSFNHVNRQDLPLAPLCLNDLTVAEDHSYCVGLNSLVVHNCLTTQQTGIGYPMASLIYECSLFAEEMDSPAKIVADGGFNKYADIIKAIALGADYVMIGGLISKMVESDSVPYLWKMIPIKNKSTAEWLFKHKAPLYKKFRGMSTKEVQRDWQKLNTSQTVSLKTSEGITKWNRVETSLMGWVVNFEDYLRSAMSYSNARDLAEFRENSAFVQITNNSHIRFKK